jgi:hypothetical protein
MSTANGHGLVDPERRGKPVSLANKGRRVHLASTVGKRGPIKAREGEAVVVVVVVVVFPPLPLRERGGGGGGESAALGGPLLSISRASSRSGGEWSEPTSSTSKGIGGTSS